MRIGYNTNGFTSHSLPDALSIIREIGYQSVALTVDHHALNPYGRDFPGDLARLRCQLADLKLQAVVETGARYLLDPRRKHYPTLLEDDAENRARRLQFLRDCVNIAAELESPVVSIWSGAIPSSTASPDDLKCRLVDALRALCEYGSAHGVAIGFEPEPGMMIENISQFKDIAAAVAHPALLLTLDIGHAHITEDSVVDTISENLGLIANVHLEGMFRARHDHLLPWDGDLDVGAVLKHLGDVGYTGPATFELSRHSHDAVNVARRVFDFARQTITR